MYIILFLENCPFSHAAKDLLDEKKLAYEMFIFSESIENPKEKYFKILNKKYKVGKNVFEKKLYKDMFGSDATFPRIYKDNQLIGGYTEFEKTL